MIRIGFVDYLKKGLEIIKLNEKVMGDVAKDQKATGMAVLFIAIAGVAMAIGTFMWMGIIFYPIAVLIGSFIGVGILHLFAKLFGGKGAFMDLYRVFGIGYILSWISVIPVVGPMISGIAGLWMIVVSIIAVRKVHSLSTGKAVAVVLIPVVIAIVLGVILAAAMAALFFAAIGGAGGLPQLQ